MADQRTLFSYRYERIMTELSAIEPDIQQGRYARRSGTTIYLPGREFTFNDETEAKLFQLFCVVEVRRARDNLYDKLAKLGKSG